MLKRLTIYLIFADDCKDCEEMRVTLQDAISQSSYDKGYCTISEINSSTDEAIDMAIDNDINDLPACLIGNYSFCGKNGYNYDSILVAIEKTWDEDSGEKNEETNMRIY